MKGVYSGLYLGLEVGNGGVGDLLKQCVGHLGLLEAECLGDIKVLAALALNAVAENGPGRSGESDQRNTVVEFFKRHFHGIKHVLQFVVHVGHLHAGQVFFGSDGVRQIGPESGAHFYLYVHRLRNHQNITEQNGGVHSVSPKRLHGDLRGELWGLTAGEKVVLGAQFHEFGKVASGLTHHPHRWARYGFSAQCF